MNVWIEESREGYICSREGGGGVVKPKLFKYFCYWAAGSRFAAKISAFGDYIVSAGQMRAHVKMSDLCSSEVWVFRTMMFCFIVFAASVVGSINHLSGLSF